MQNLECINKEQPILPTESLFQYTGYQRYIELLEKYRVGNNEEILVSHFILDENFSIIHKKNKEIIALIDEDEPIKIQETERELLYLIREEKKPIIYRKSYKKYIQLNNFIFGRQQWGRTYNCLRIANDLISRTHSTLTYVKKQSQNLLKSIQSIVQKQTHYSSPLRKIPSELWNKIMEYAEEKEKYTIKDCGSRNGTFLMDRSIHSIAVKQGQGYEFQNREYIIYINLIISDKGANLSNKLKAFQSNWKLQQFYNHHHTLKIIGHEDLLQELQNMETIVQAIHFQIDFSHELKYFFWIIQESTQETSYNIGQSQTISISSSLDRYSYDSGRHGILCFNKDQWQLHSLQQFENIWVKLSSQVQYELATSNQYRIRLGPLNVIDIAFHHF